MKKLLIIDDSLMDRKLLTSLIKKTGLENEILQAADGEEGFRILNDNVNDIGIILLDWQMPKMTGIDFMKAVGKIPTLNQVPIIMVTASGSEDSKKEAYSVNPRLAGYMVKPYKSDVLMALIKPFLI
jgi:two-component system chemotaxis response regulator CheY